MTLTGARRRWRALPLSCSLTSWTGAGENAATSSSRIRTRAAVLAVFIGLLLALLVVPSTSARNDVSLGSCAALAPRSLAGIVVLVTGASIDQSSCLDFLRGTGWSWTPYFGNRNDRGPVRCSYLNARRHVYARVYATAGPWNSVLAQYAASFCRQVTPRWAKLGFHRLR
jgi:hypothetical protein